MRNLSIMNDTQPKFLVLQENLRNYNESKSVQYQLSNKDVEKSKTLPTVFPKEE